MKKLLKQILLLIPSVTSLSLGISLNVLTGLGSAANASFPQAIARIVTVPVGTLVFAYNVIILAIYLLVVTIIGTVNAYNSEMTELPLIGKIKILK